MALQWIAACRVRLFLAMDGAMFERRLKVFLGFLVLFILLLLARAGQLQVVERERWSIAAEKSRRRCRPIETVRGNIFDIKGRLIATDVPCTDVCIDYRALTDPPDGAWVAAKAAERLRARLGDEFAKKPKKVRSELLAAETDAVKADIRQMWDLLATIGGKPREDIDEARTAILRRVEMRQKLVWYNNYAAAREKSARNGKIAPEQESLWRRWLIGEDAPSGPDIDNYAISIDEQTAPHAILRAVDDDVQNRLGKNAGRLPGMVLRPGTHRFYPYGTAFCHGMGHVGHVDRQDLKDDPMANDDTRRYLPNDLIGRAGVESLCEQALRGCKGKIETVAGNPVPVATTPPVAGSDVRLSIDIELQAAIEDAFTHAHFINSDKAEETALVHGGAVVIDVPTGEVRALASYPTYDLNQFDDQYQQLHDDQLNNALFNRATMSQLQPGSTVKPMVGISAISEGVLTPDDTIECTGFLVIDGKRQPNGRCWEETMFGAQLRAMGMTSAHHPFPSRAPHPTGFLTFGDALERSCNVFFETVADRLGMDLLSLWYSRWGLGRPTGIGIPEYHGRLPNRLTGPLWAKRQKTWFSGIGQDPVAATPIQMANIAATIARDGVWMRPRLLSDEEARELDIRPVQPRPAGAPANQPPAYYPDRVDLKLSPAGLAAARDGMERVVTGPAGTGTGVLNFASEQLKSIRMCCKTGTAQASPFKVKLKEHGKAVLDQNGKQVYAPLIPSTKEHPSDINPWYRGNGKDGIQIDHAWYIGFAPAGHPQVAFAVMVEYGGSGGGAAAAIARVALETCIAQGYLTP
jgi:penicillin-binding protein 2